MYFVTCGNNRVYAIEKEQVQATHVSDPEHQALLSDPNLAGDEKLTRSLDKEVERIVLFYKEKEAELTTEYEQLVSDETEFQHEMQSTSNAGGSVVGRRASKGSLRRVGVRRASTGSLEPVDEGEGSSDEEGPSRPGTSGLMGDEPGHEWPPTPSTVRRPDSSSMYQPSPYPSTPGGRSYARRSSMVFMEDDPYSDYTVSDTRITLKKRTIACYVSLCELKSYVQLNWTGFSKLLKKYDKTCNRKLRQHYLSQRVEKEYPFLVETRDALNEKIANTEEIYARVCTDGDVPAAKKELKLHLREHVVWERNTVWRDMIGIERKAQAAALGIRKALLGGKREAQGTTDEESKELAISTPVGKIKLPRWCPTWLFSANMATLIISLAVFFTLLFTPTFKAVEQANCLAMLVFVSILWATEVIPLFVTSLLVPMLCVLLRVCRTDDKEHVRLPAGAATKYIFSAMWTPVIMLLLGGFALAAALSKFGIAKSLATYILSKAGTKPRNVLLVNMFVAMVASMWISNVAAPVLCFSIIQPVLRTLPADSPFAKSLILGIALASNIGGMASPIASPQNAIALQNMHPTPSWGEWFFVSLPVCVLCVCGIWLLLLATYHPGIPHFMRFY